MHRVYDINPGDQASQSKTFLEADMVLFACMTIHMEGLEIHA